MAFRPSGNRTARAEQTFNILCNVIMNGQNFCPFIIKNIWLNLCCRSSFLLWVNVDCFVVAFCCGRMLIVLGFGLLLLAFGARRVGCVVVGAK